MIVQARSQSCLVERMSRGDVDAVYKKDDTHLHRQITLKPPPKAAAKVPDQLVPLQILATWARKRLNMNPGRGSAAWV